MEERHLVPWQEEPFFLSHESNGLLKACQIHHGGWWQRGRENQSHGMAGHGIVSRRAEPRAVHLPS